MAHRDPYDVLEVHPSADLREIKKAYRRLARQHHPDAQGDPASARRFIEIRRAYEAIVERRGQPTSSQPGSTEPDADADSTGFEYDVDFGDEAGPFGEEDIEPEAEEEPGPFGTWREAAGRFRDWLIAELWAVILIAVCAVPLIGALLLARWIGPRWFFFLCTLWLLTLAIIRPDRWQRD